MNDSKSKADTLRARPRRRRLPEDESDRQIATVPSNILDRQFVGERPNKKWIADFTYSAPRPTAGEAYDWIAKEKGELRKK